MPQWSLRLCFGRRAPRTQSASLAFLIAASAAFACRAAPPAPSLAPNKVETNALAAPSLNPRKERASGRAVGPAGAPTSAAAPLQSTGKAPGESRAVIPALIRLGARASDAPSPPAPFAGALPKPAFAVPPQEGAVPRIFAPNIGAPDRDVSRPPNTVNVILQQGETFVEALEREGVRRDDRNAAAAALAKAVNLRTLQPGATFQAVLARPNATLFQSLLTDDDPLHLSALTYRPEATRLIRLTRLSDGFAADIEERALDTRLAAVGGEISGSLFVSARAKGAPAGAIIKLANMFAYDIDFQRDIFSGDAYEAVFEALYDDDGDLVGAGDVVYGRLSWRGGRKSKGYYRFQSQDGGARADFYDANGQSAKRLLMKTPIDGARLSSGFGARRHPVLGYRKQHKGVDFAARRGTPIYAAGDGVVERANRYGSFGNYVRIRHAQGYKTAYAHLKGFRRGIRKGVRVEQGDVIGYVGTTGRSTGPHLHYEVIKNGKHVNPQRLKIATGVQLKGAELERFKAVRDRIDAMRAAAADKDAERDANEDATADRQNSPAGAKTVSR
ncbi:MAG: peptidoglycan DD-metalloendopeptidase family protein [Pseudomonadota bacterium]